MNWLKGGIEPKATDVHFKCANGLKKENCLKMGKLKKKSIGEEVFWTFNNIFFYFDEAKATN